MTSLKRTRSLVPAATTFPEWRLRPNWSWLIWGGLVMLVIAIGVVWTNSFLMQDRLRGWGQKLGVFPPPLPTVIEPILPADRDTSRRQLIEQLQDYQSRGHYLEAARINADLSHQAFQVSYRIEQAWLGARSPRTGLIPLVVHPHFYREFEWNTAANNLSHLLVASHYLVPADEATWMTAYQTAREICGELFCAIHPDTGRILPQDLDTRIFATSEVSKDGLLNITERLGPGPWLDLMQTYTHTLLDGAGVLSDFGYLPTNGSEKNGEMLQVLSRLYWLTREPRYLEMAERIADAYLFEVIPANNGLPADYWDFENHRPLPEDKRFRPAVEVTSNVFAFRLSDHGGEIVPGLSELYFLEKKLSLPNAERYRGPLADLLEKIRANGVNADGLLVSSINTATQKFYDYHPADTWGYILNAYQTYDLAEGNQENFTFIQDVMRAVAKQKSIEWEGQQADGYSDTLESMLYLLPYYEIPEARTWVDSEMEVLFAKQQENGFVENWHLDGNVIRTSMMYGFYKTRGTFLSPWEPSIHLGAELDRAANSLYLYADTSASQWSGKLVFDGLRHRTIWGMPVDYPRVNGSPEWFSVEPDANYEVMNLKTGKITMVSGKALLEGLPVTLGGPENTVLELKVTRR